MSAIIIPEAKKKDNSTEMIRNKWYVENITADLLHVSSIKSLEYVARSKFQDVEIVTLGSFGRCLLLDNKLQSSEVDEKAYHEPLVHPAMFLHPNPKKVFIGGGGEGATAREVLRHKSVEECIMVDIDGDVCEMSKKLLKKHHMGAFDDKRFKLIVDDCKIHIEKAADNSLDVIILDLADPVEGNPCFQLYTVEFYNLCKKKLKNGGVIVTQSGPAGLCSYLEVFTPIAKTLQTVFGKDNTFIQTTHVPSFVDMYGYTIAVKSDKKIESPKTWSEEKVDKLIKERLNTPLKFIDGETWKGLFSIPKPIRDYLENKETRIIKKGSYLYMSDEHNASEPELYEL